jgi:hypothetical protein
MDLTTTALVAYLAVATAAFVLTQVHLIHRANKIINGSKESWAKAQQTIFEAEKVIHDDVVKQISESGKNSPLGDVIPTIAELELRVNGLPGVIEDRMLKIQGGLRESFVMFGDQLGKTLEALIPKAPQRIPFGGDPRGAQSNSADARRVNQIVKTLEVGVGTGGNLQGAVNEVADLLNQFGSPDLADWLHDNPDKLPMIYQTIQRNPRLAQGLAKFEQKIAGQAPGNGSARQGGYDLR